MSFRCDNCHQAFPAGAKPNVVVVEWYAEPKQIKREIRICDGCAGKNVEPLRVSIEAVVQSTQERS